MAALKPRTLSQGIAWILQRGLVTQDVRSKGQRVVVANRAGMHLARLVWKSWEKTQRVWEELNWKGEKRR